MIGIDPRQRLFVRTTLNGRQIAESLIEGRSVPGSLSHLTICTGVAEGLGQVAVKVAAPPVHETPDLPELLHDAADSA
jgi:hypothetical protein